MTHNTLARRRSRLVPLAFAVAVLVAFGSASAGALGTDKDESQTSNAVTATSLDKASVKSLQKQVKKLTKRIVALEQKKFPDSASPSGPARGDLTGSYPTLPSRRTLSGRGRSRTRR